MHVYCCCVASAATTLALPLNWKTNGRCILHTRYPVQVMPRGCVRQRTVLRHTEIRTPILQHQLSPSLSYACYIFILLKCPRKYEIVVLRSFHPISESRAHKYVLTGK